MIAARSALTHVLFTLPRIKGFDDLDLTIKPGRKESASVGASGAGKIDVVNLLLRFP